MKSTYQSVIFMFLFMNLNNITLNYYITTLITLHQFIDYESYALFHAHILAYFVIKLFILSLAFKKEVFLTFLINCQGGNFSTVIIASLNDILFEADLIGRSILNFF
jgi:hypothetical protein